MNQCLNLFVSKQSVIDRKMIGIFEIYSLLTLRFFMRRFSQLWPHPKSLTSSNESYVLVELMETASPLVTSTKIFLP